MRRTLRKALDSGEVEQRILFEVEEADGKQGYAGYEDGGFVAEGEDGGENSIGAAAATAVCGSGAGVERFRGGVVHFGPLRDEEKLKDEAL